MGLFVASGSGVVVGFFDAEVLLVGDAADGGFGAPGVAVLVTFAVLGGAGGVGLVGVAEE